VQKARQEVSVEASCDVAENPCSDQTPHITFCSPLHTPGIPRFCHKYSIFLI